jgi:hypothetical protein
VSGAGVSGDDKAACCRACSALGFVMAEDGRNAPVWWDRESDSSGRQIRADVRAAAHEIWPSACRHTQALLHDTGDAAELMEKAVAQVSQYLDRACADPYSQNTKGILMCAFCRAGTRQSLIGCNVSVEALSFQSESSLPVGQPCSNFVWTSQGSAATFPRKLGLCLVSAARGSSGMK